MNDARAYLRKQTGHQLDGLFERFTHGGVRREQLGTPQRGRGGGGREHGGGGAAPWPGAEQLLQQPPAVLETRARLVCI